mgnify:CR=1 FL=1
MLEVLIWVFVGVVLKTLVPMPWLDNSVKNAWATIKGWFN